MGGIAFFLAGAFPLMVLVRKLLAPFLKKLGSLLRIGPTGIGGLLVSIVNGIPAVAKLNDMDSRSRMFVTAGLVSGSCLIGDHAAFTAQMAPELCGAVIAGKAVGMLAAVGLSMLAADRLLGGESRRA